MAAQTADSYSAYRTLVPPTAQPGCVMLFRAQGAQANTLTKNPSWVAESEIFKNTLSASGRWFTDDYAEALWYLENEYPDGNGLLMTVDMPKIEAEAYRVANFPPKIGGKNIEDNPLAFSRRPEKEFYLPKDIAGLAKPIIASAPARAAGTNQSNEGNTRHTKEEVLELLSAKAPTLLPHIKHDREWLWYCGPTLARTKGGPDTNQPLRRALAEVGFRYSVAGHVMPDNQTVGTWGNSCSYVPSKKDPIESKLTIEPAKDCWGHPNSELLSYSEQGGGSSSAMFTPQINAAGEQTGKMEMRIIQWNAYPIEALAGGIKATKEYIGKGFARRALLAIGGEALKRGIDTLTVFAPTDDSKAVLQHYVDKEWLSPGGESDLVGFPTSFTLTPKFVRAHSHTMDKETHPDDEVKIAEANAQKLVDSNFTLTFTEPSMG